MSEVDLKNRLIIYLAKTYFFLNWDIQLFENIVTSILKKEGIDDAILLKCEEDLAVNLALMITEEVDINFINTFVSNVSLNERHSKIQRLRLIGLFFDNIDNFKQTKIYFETLKKNVEFNDLIESFISLSDKELEEIFSDPVLASIFQDYNSFNENEELDESFHIKNKVDIIEVDAFKSLVRELNTLHPNILSLEETKDLLVRYSHGDKAARNNLVENNWRLILSVAKDYIGYGVPLLDLFQEGCIGMIKAINHFDITREVKLSTYAVFWIRASISRAIENTGKSIRVSSHKLAQQRKVFQKRNELYKKLNREPTISEVAHELNMNEKMVWQIYQIPNVSKSLDEPLTLEDDGTKVGDFVVDSNAVSPIDNAIINSEYSELNYYLSLLPNRQATILRMRNGFYDDRVMTLAEIARLFGITESAVKHQEQSGLKEIRSFMKNPQLPLNLPDYNLRSLNSNILDQIVLYYDGYGTKKQIQEAINQLADLDIFILSEIVSSKKCTFEMKKTFYNIINKKILSFLENKFGKKDDDLILRDKVVKYFKNYSLDEVEYVINSLDEYDMELLTYKFLPPKRNVIIEVEEVKTRFRQYLSPKMYKCFDKIHFDESVAKKRKRFKETEYEYFSDFSRDLVDAIVETLTPKEKSIYNARFHCDGKVSKEAKEAFNKTLRYKIKWRLKQVRDGKQTIEYYNRRKSVYNYYAKFTKEEIDFALDSLNEYDRNIVFTMFSDECNDSVKRQFYDSIKGKLLYRLVNQDTNSSLFSSGDGISNSTLENGKGSMKQKKKMLRVQSARK